MGAKFWSMNETKQKELGFEEASIHTLYNE